MTAEQLQAARAAHWRQQKNPVLTLDDAVGWLEQHPLCLYLPRRAQLPAPAPSFVEAVLGTPAATPGTDAIAQAQALLTRLIDSGAVVALNLFGAVGEQPDFLVARQALPYVLCLRADADWKHAPEKSSGHKVSPLVLELWKALNQDGKDGGLTAPEARETLGRELTEAAVLRGLGELWQGLRIAPVFQETGLPARWELLRVRHRDALATAGATGQVTALSLLVSIYLQSVYAASSEEIEIFLSPLASRSRVREAVRGLSATRQIHSLSMDAQTYYFLEGGLPEFAESELPRSAGIPLAGPREVRVSPPPRPMPPAPREQRIKPAGKEWKKPGGGEKSAFARPSSPPTRSFAPAPGPGAEANRGRGTNDGQPHRGARPGPAKGRETKPARPEVSREWRKPPLPGKPAGARSSYPSPRSFRQASTPGAQNRPRGPQRSDAPGRSGARPEKRPGERPARPRGERPAPWVRSSSKPPFRAAQRPSGPKEQRRPDGPVSGRPAGIAPPEGRSSGRSPVSFRSQSGGSRPEGARPAGSRPGRPDGRPGGATGTRRTGNPGNRPPRPFTPRDGDHQAARPPSVPASRAAKPWQRAGSSSARPAGKQGRFGGKPGETPGGKPEGRFGGRPGGTPGGKPEGRFGGRPGGRPGGKPGGKPANFQRRKPARKKPGA